MVLLKESLIIYNNKQKNKELLERLIKLDNYFSKLVNFIMVDGKKSKSINQIESILHEFFLKQKSIYLLDDFLYKVEEAADIIRPFCTFKLVRRGSVIFKVPYFFSEKVSKNRGLKILILESRKRKQSFAKAFVSILDEVLAIKGPLIDKKKETTSLVLENQVYRTFISGRNRRKRGKRKIF